MAAIREAYTRSALRPAGLIRAGGDKVIRAQRGQSPEADEIRAQWNGWLTDILIKMYEAQSFVWPLWGVARFKPIHNISGYRADTLAAWWQQLMSTLETGATKADPQFTRGAVAGGAALTVALTVSSIGAIVTLSDVIDSENNGVFEIEHFTAGTQLDYEIVPDFRRGNLSYVILHVQNDRGSGIITRRDDLNARTIAAQRRDASTVTIETINYRDLQP
jgi:hypothetical protein